MGTDEPMGYETAEMLMATLDVAFEMGFKEAFKAIQNAEALGIATLVSSNDDILASFVMNYKDNAKADVYQSLLRRLKGERAKEQ